MWIGKNNSAARTDNKKWGTFADPTTDRYSLECHLKKAFFTYLKVFLNSEYLKSGRLTYQSVFFALTSLNSYAFNQAFLNM